MMTGPRHGNVETAIPLHASDLFVVHHYCICITCTRQDIDEVKLRTAVVVVVVAMVIEIVTSVFIRIYFLPRSG